MKRWDSALLFLVTKSQFISPLRFKVTRQELVAMSIRVREHSQLIKVRVKIILLLKISKPCNDTCHSSPCHVLNTLD